MKLFRHTTYKILHTKRYFAFAALLFLIVVVPVTIYLAKNPLKAKADSQISFNEGRGSTVKDEASAVTGTITNALWQTEDLCFFGKCLYFDGTGDYVSFGDVATYDFAETANFTLSVWFRTPDITSGTRVLISKYRGDDSEGGYKIYLNSSGQICFGVDDDNSWGPDDSACSPNAYDDSRWHYLSAVKTGTTSLTLYIDANLVANDVSLQATGTLVNDDPFTLGMDADLSSNPYTGFLDELKVYTTTARSEIEVKSDYMGTTSDRGTSAEFAPDTSGLSNGLVGYWQLDETLLENFTALIVENADDGWENNNSTWDANGWNNEFDIIGYWGVDEEAGFRFQNVTIPKGATISSALITFVSGMDDGSNLSYRIYADDVDNASVWSSTSRPSQITQTTAYVDWTTNWVAVGTSIATPDISSVIQEIVNRGNWSAGNSIRLAILNNGTSGTNDAGIIDYNDTTYDPASLNITYGVIPNDLSGNSNSLTNSGATSASGKFGNGSEHVPASSQYLYSASTINGVKTVSFWTNPDSTTNYYLSLTSGAYLTSSAGTLSATGLTNAKIYINGVPTTTIAADTWQHVVVTFDSIDANQFYIGRQGSNYFDGTMDEVRLYNRTLSEAEVAKLYGFATGPVAYYSFDEGNGTTTVYDRSSHGNDLTMTNMASTWTDGKFGKALTFDGTNDYTTRAYDSDFGFGTGNFTIDGWFKRPVSGNSMGSNGDAYGIINFGGFEHDDDTLADDEGGIDVYSYETEDDSGPFAYASIQSTTKRSGEYAYEYDGTSGVFEGEYITIKNPDRSNLGNEPLWLTFYFRPVEQVSGTESTIADYNGYCGISLVWQRDTWNLELEADTHSNPAAVTPNQWNKIEMMVDCANDNATLAVNDNTPVSAHPWGGGPDNAFSLGELYNMTWGKAQFDDWVLSTAELDFDPKVVRMDVDGDGNSTDWDASNGYQEVDEMPQDGDNSYITSSTATNKQLVSLESASSAGVVGNILGVKTQALVRDEGGTSNLATVLRLGGTVYDRGEDVDPGSAYVSIGSTLTANPATSFALSSSDLDDMQIGVLNNASVASRVTAMSAMVLTDGNTNPNPGYLVSRYDEDQGYKVWLDSSSKLTFAIDDDSTWGSYPDDIATSSAAYNDNTWHHFSAVKNTTGIYLYVDGTPAGSDTSLAATGTLTSDSAPFTLGSNEPTNGYFFNGSLDDFRLYNYARTPAQIIEDMNAGHPAPGSPIGSSISHWKFDEGYGTTANDSGTGDNDLTFATASWTNAGKYGKAYQGASNYRLSKTDDSDLDFDATDGFTLSTWFKRDTVSAAEYLIYKENGNEGYTLYLDSDGDVVFGIGDTSSGSFPEESIGGSLSKNYDDNAWHHAVAVKDGTSSIKLYVDGQIINSDPSLAVDATMANSGTFYMGDANGTDGTDEFLGILDDTKIFRSALTLDQIKLLYNQGQATVMGALSTDSTGGVSNAAADAYCPPGQGSACVGPMGEWKMDEGSGTSYNDSSGNNLHADAFSGSGTQHWANGKFGSAGYFNGVDDIARIDDSDSMTFGNGTTDSPFSVSVWVNLSDVTTGSIFTKSNEYWLFLNSSGYLKFQLSDYNNSSYNIRRIYSTVFPTNGWHHIETTYSGSGVASGIKLYLDGVRVDDSNDNNGTYVAMGNKTSGLSFGGSSYPTNGMVDEVRMYNYERTPAQIAWDYNQGAPLAHYRLDECTGSTAYDIAPKPNKLDTGYDATIYPGDNSGDNDTVGSCSSGVTTEMWYDGATGKYSGSLGFDGTNDYAATGNTALIAANSVTYTNLSWGGWVKPATSPTSDTLIHKNNEFRLTTDASAYPQCEIYSGSWQTAVTATTALPTATWSHVLCTYDGTNLKLYVNGSLVKTLPETDAITSSSATALNLARDSAASGYFDGLLDEIKVWTYPLSAQQVQLDYNQGAVNFGP